MAGLSASPSGRRLSELLEEKQEPFFLDLHLLEKGCSSRLLDGYDSTVAMCWPAAAASNDAAASVLRRLTSKKKKEAARGGAKKTKKPAAAAAAATGLLRVLLSKILHGKAANNRKPAALQSSESFNFKKVASAAAAAPSPCSTKHHHLDAVEVAAADEEEEEMEYTDSESDDEKQFSPVSVLEHPFESSPIHKRSPSRAAQPQGSPKNAMEFVRDLLEAAYSPALLTHLLSKTDDLIKATDAAFDDIDDDDDDCYHHHHHRTSPKNTNDGGELAAAYWEAHRAELTRVSALVASEVPSSSRIGVADVRPERDGVGAELEAAVLEQLLHELAVELAGGC